MILSVGDRLRSYALAERGAERPIENRMGASHGDAEWVVLVVVVVVVVVVLIVKNGGIGKRKNM
jgi:hypothetical protein